MDKKTAKQIVKDLDIDEQQDLLMYLAEIFDYRVISSEGKNKTYFIATDYAIFGKNKNERQGN